MEFDQLLGRYLRLKQALSIAYEARTWRSARIDRLADALVATERQIASWPHSHRVADASH